jgi:fumarate reductase subunit C
LSYDSRVDRRWATRRAANARYEPYHPKWYRKRVPIFWWLENVAYVKFITRELTSLAVGYAAVLLLVQIWVMSSGQGAYERFLEAMATPPMVAFNAVMFLLVWFHTITWLNLAPQALVIRLAGRRVPSGAVLAGHYAALVVTSAAVVWYLLGAGW